MCQWLLEIFAAGTGTEWQQAWGEGCWQYEMARGERREAGEQRPPKRFGVLLSLFLIWICVCQNVNKHGRAEGWTEGQRDGQLTMVLTFILLFIFPTYVYICIYIFIFYFMCCASECVCVWLGKFLIFIWLAEFAFILCCQLPLTKFYANWFRILK